MTSVRVLLRLVSVEFLKLRTTQAWWLFLGGFTMLAALAVLFGWVSHHQELYPPPDLTNEADARALAAGDRTPAGAVALAASMMTSGQFLLMVVAMLLGAHLVTTEFAQRTVTGTFLVTPRRSSVVVAKLCAAACFGAVFWLIATALDAIVTPLFLSAHHLPASVLSWPVVRSVLLGLAAYVMWACLGLGLGAAIRHQVGTVIACFAIYAGGLAAVTAIVGGLHYAWPENWLAGATVLAPAEATNIMVTARQAFTHAPPQWVGAVVLVVYSAALTAYGAAAIRRSDIS
jgi:hypothetical protein